MDFATALGHELRRYPSLLELHQFLDPNPAVAGDGDDEDDDLASAQLKETASDGSACPICLLDDDDDDEDTAMAEGEWKETSCGHRFHGPCIDKWLSDKGSCPLCRRQLLKTTTKPPATVAPEDLDLVWNDLLGLYGEELVAGLSFVEFLDQNLG
ncbi:hypothetical protein BRADI_1g51056v3 [Brachypodium distachyon]|uniref:RING-type domain-containing protein n=1 Tax=Brachypodium distachyon TaxID=15368 RepID=A0A0Q3K5Q7_BRADI|nr:hypothetical protein BRADI_1g51056v3 [Brachypodium distachyon]